MNNISSPSHYTQGRQYEPRKVITDWELNFYLGNVVKYISRAGRKGGADDHIDDLLKAKQYLEWEIERITNLYCSQAILEAYEECKKEIELYASPSEVYKQSPVSDCMGEGIKKVAYPPNEYGEQYD